MSVERYDCCSYAALALFMLAVAALWGGYQGQLPAPGGTSSLDMSRINHHQLSNYYLQIQKNMAGPVYPLRLMMNTASFECFLEFEWRMNLISGFK